MMEFQSSPTATMKMVRRAERGVLKLVRGDRCGLSMIYCLVAGTSS